MKNLKLIILFILSISLTSCFKTAEEIRREKRVNEQLEQSSKIIAELTSQVQELKGGLASTSGQIEELDHKSLKTKEEQDQTFSQTIAQLAEQVKLLSSENQKISTELNQIKEEQVEQKKFLKKITASLKSFGESNSPKKRAKSKLQKAHKLFEKNKLKNAKQLYTELISGKSINAAQRNHVYFNLGLINYWKKSYNEALVFFSKIYTKYPRSSFAPRSLLYIGRCFRGLNKNEEANATFNELINKGYR